MKKISIEFVTSKLSTEIQNDMYKSIQNITKIRNIYLLMKVFDEYLDILHSEKQKQLLLFNLNNKCSIDITACDIDSFTYCKLHNYHEHHHYNNHQRISVSFFIAHVLLATVRM